VKIKLDENIIWDAAEQLKAKGYDVTTVPQQEMAGWSDRKLWSVVQEEGRFLITQDKGFADVRRYPPGSHCGVLLLRPEKSAPSNISSFFRQIINTVPLHRLEKCIAVATPHGIRVRRPR
jgi:predicted nuclease of predicted toxin-antitoxin system